MPGTRTLPCNKRKRRASTSNNGKLETPSARAKWKRKAATTHVKAAAGNIRAELKSTGMQEIPDENAEESNPEEVNEKLPKRHIVPPPGKKRKQIVLRKAVVKGRGWETITIEEIDDDSTYSYGDVDKEEDKSVNSEDGKEKRGADNNDNNFALTNPSGNDDSGENGMMERFERDVASARAEVERRCSKELNSRAQQGA